MIFVRVRLPAHLRALAGVEGALTLEVADPPTIGGLLDALEARCPALRGTVRHHDGSRRRDLIRFYAGSRDLSHEPLDTPLPEPVLAGEEVFHVVGAIAGG